MNFGSTAKQSIIALRANKLRSVFSILGIVIGVAAVVIILSMGQGLKGMITNEIEAFGSDILDIAIKVPGQGQLGTVSSIVQGVMITTLKTRDVEALRNKNRFPYIEAVSGQAIGQEWITYKNNEKKILLYGCNADFPAIMKTAKIDKGRFFTVSEDKSMARVAVLGNEVATGLFGREDPVNKKIKLKGQNFKVVGVLEPMGGFSMGGIDMNNFVYLPLETTLKGVLGIDYVSEIMLTVKDSSYFSQATKEIARMLRYNHNIKDPEKDDFQITSMTEIMEQVNDISIILNLLLGFLAAISLLVGGIGIMNIMLVSVSERTREIGLRKSLGASRKDILWHFLIEAIIITGLGGLIGILIGIVFSVGGSFAVRSYGLSSWPIIISWLAIVFAFSVSALIGIVFGIYPAYKAAQLDPIRALKKE